MEKSKIEALERKITELEREIEQSDKSNESQEQSKHLSSRSLSRRSFLKKLGLGTLSLGALTFTPVSALNIRDSNGLNVYSDAVQSLDVKPNGNIDVSNGQISEKGNRVATRNWTKNLDATQLSGGGSSGQVLTTDGTSLSWSDNTSSTSKMVEKQKASTFQESDLTITHNETRINNGRLTIDPGMVQDFESQDGTTSNSNWIQTRTRYQGHKKNSSYETNNPIRGNSSLNLVNDGGGIEYEITRDSELQPTYISAYIECKQRDNHSGDGGYFRFRDGSGNLIINFDLLGNGNFEINGSTGSSYDNDTVYKFVAKNIDYSAEIFDWEIINVEYDVVIDSGTGLSFYSSGNGLKKISYGLTSGGSDGNCQYWYDNIFVSGGGPLEGNAVLSWSSPVDIYEWDIATFQRELNNGDITVDVEDSDGNKLLSDINRNTDISSLPASTDIQLRFSFSRSEGNLSPKVHFAGLQYIQ